MPEVLITAVDPPYPETAEKKGRPSWRYTTNGANGMPEKVFTKLDKFGGQLNDQHQLPLAQNALIKGGVYDMTVKMFGPNNNVAYIEECEVVQLGQAVNQDPEQMVDQAMSNDHPPQQVPNASTQIHTPPSSDIQPGGGSEYNPAYANQGDTVGVAVPAGGAPGPAMAVPQPQEGFKQMSESATQMQEENREKERRRQISIVTQTCMKVAGATLPAGCTTEDINQRVKDLMTIHSTVVEMWLEDIPF